MNSGIFFSFYFLIINFFCSVSKDLAFLFLNPGKFGNEYGSNLELLLFVILSSSYKFLKSFCDLLSLICWIRCRDLSIEWFLFRSSYFFMKVFNDAGDRENLVILKRSWDRFFHYLGV